MEYCQLTFSLSDIFIIILSVLIDLEDYLILISIIISFNFLFIPFLCVFYIMHLDPIHLFIPSYPPLQPPSKIKAIKRKKKRRGKEKKYPHGSCNVT